MFNESISFQIRKSRSILAIMVVGLTGPAGIQTCTCSFILDGGAEEDLSKVRGVLVSSKANDILRDQLGAEAGRSQDHNMSSEWQRSWYCRTNNANATNLGMRRLMNVPEQSDGSSENRQVK